MSKGKGAKRFHGTHVKHQPYQTRPQSPGESPTLSDSDVGSLSSPTDDRADAGDGTYGLSSLSEKTRKSHLLQMS